MRLHTPLALAAAAAALIACGSDPSGRGMVVPTPRTTGPATPSPGLSPPPPTASPSPQPVLWVAGCGAPADASCGCSRNLSYCAQGVLARSDDLGETWSRTFFATGLGSVDFPTPTNGWAVGAGGFVVRTTDGGRTWQPKSDGIHLPPAATAHGVAAFNSVRFADEKRGIIAGWGYSNEVIGSSGLGVLYRPEVFVLLTTDGGETWNPASIVGGASGPSPPDGETYASEACFADQLGLIAGQPSLLTRDGGGTWENIAERSGLATGWGAECSDDGTLWLADSTGVARSLDRGETWTLISDPAATPANCCSTRLDFLTDQDGWRSGLEVAHTDDGGHTWSVVDAAIPEGFGTSAIRFATADDGVWTGTGLGGVTHDGGASWHGIIVVPFREGLFGLADVAVAGGSKRRVASDPRGR